MLSPPKGACTASNQTPLLSSGSNCCSLATWVRKDRDADGFWGNYPLQARPCLAITTSAVPPPSLCILCNPLVDRQPTTALSSSTTTP